MQISRGGAGTADTRSETDRVVGPDRDVPREQTGGRARRDRRERNLAPLIVTIFCALVGIAFASPLGELVWRSFQKSTGLLTWVYSFDGYRRVFTSSIGRAALASFEIGVSTAIVATAIGATIAWMVSRTDLPGRRAFEIINFVPFFLSPFIGAIAWGYLGSPNNGLLNGWAVSSGLFHSAPLNMYSLYGIIIVLVIAHVPLSMILTSASLRQMDPALEQAARTCGANPFRASVRVTLALARPAILSAAILTFVLAIEDLGSPLVLGYSSGVQTLSTQIWGSVQKAFPADYSFAATLGCVMMVITIFAVMMQRWALGRRSYVTVSGKASAPRLVELGKARWPLFALNFLYVFIAVVLPVGTLVLTAFSKRWTGEIKPSLFTMANWHLMFDNSLVPTALEHSVTLAVVAATGAVLVSIIATYGVDRMHIKGGKIVDTILTLPVAVPGLALAVGLLDLLIRTPLYATIWIIGIAYAIRYFPYAHRSVQASLTALHPELEEAARISGSGLARIIRRILMPLMTAGIARGWLLLFVMFMREVSMSNLLYSGSNQTLSTALLDMVGNQPAGVTAAFTLLQTLLILIPATAIMLVADRRGTGDYGSFLGVHGGQ